MVELAENNKVHMAQVQAFERNKRQNMLLSQKNESRVMSALLHAVAAKLAFKQD